MAGTSSWHALQDAVKHCRRDDTQMSLQPTSPDTPARFLFTGDLSITGVFRQRLSDGQEVLSAEIRQLIAEHDVGVANLEGPATSGED